LPEHQPEAPPQYLVDAYCGSGLFSICLAKRFAEVSGVEISDDSVRYARRNAALNQIENVAFLTGKAEAIFEVRRPPPHVLRPYRALLQSIMFPPAQTTVLIDPPRKGWCVALPCMGQRGSDTLAQRRAVPVPIGPLRPGAHPLRVVQRLDAGPRRRRPRPNGRVQARVDPWRRPLPSYVHHVIDWGAVF
jgi:hypothetical protein